MKIQRVASQLIIEPEHQEPYRLYDEQHTLLYEGTAAYHDVRDIVHPIFFVEQGNNSFYISERNVPQTKITNFRDLGGYYGADHRQVKYGLFYRCAPVITKDEESYRAVTDLQLKTILDLRSSEEVLKDQDQTFEGTTYIQISAISDDLQHQGNFDFAQLMKENPIATLQSYMKQMYQRLPFKNPAYQAMFDAMLEDELPIAFHCSAGKDRTGFAAYLILKTLGVDDDTIMEDYLLSNVYRKEENEAICATAGSKKDLVMSLMEVQSAYLQAALVAIQQEYDSFESYLEKEYQINKADITILRNKYLYTNN